MGDPRPRRRPVGPGGDDRGCRARGSRTGSHRRHVPPGRPSTVPTAAAPGRVGATAVLQGQAHASPSAHARQSKAGMGQLRPDRARSAAAASEQPLARMRSSLRCRNLRVAGGPTLERDPSPGACRTLIIVPALRLPLRDERRTVKRTTCSGRPEPDGPYLTRRDGRAASPVHGPLDVVREDALSPSGRAAVASCGRRAFLGLPARLSTEVASLMVV